MLGAETRSFYFEDLASRYTLRKQIITGASFFLSSGTAAANAYSMAVSLDRKIGTMAKPHATWGRISADYDRLWNHAYDDDAEARLDAIAQSEIAPSELAATDAPDNQGLLGKWQEHLEFGYGSRPAPITSNTVTFPCCVTALRP
jgi:hypothetical protein